MTSVPGWTADRTNHDCSCTPACKFTLLHGAQTKMNAMEASRSHVRLGKSRARRCSQQRTCAPGSSQVLQKPALCVHPENGAAHAHAAPCIGCVETGHSRASPDNAIPAAAVRAARADRKCRVLPQPIPLPQRYLTAARVCPGPSRPRPRPRCPFKAPAGRACQATAGKSSVVSFTRLTMLVNRMALIAWMTSTIWPSV